MPSRPTASPAEWNARLAAVDVSKDDLNALVANYLFTEGYYQTSLNFSKEANLSEEIDLESIEVRRSIKSCILSGRIREAEGLCNELDPEILDQNPTLHFHLLQLHLIELIRQSLIVEALEFAQLELAPRGEEFPQFLKELEKTMTLLAFELPTLPTSLSTTTPTTSTKSPLPPQIKTLLDPSQRINLSNEMNAAILSSQSRGTESKLPGLMKILAWGEGMLEEKGDFPKWDFRALGNEGGMEL